MYARYIAGLKRRLFKLSYMFFCIMPMNKKKISFASDSRSELNGNLLFVYNELQSRHLNLKINLFLNKRVDNKKSCLYLIRMAYHFATSKIILLDDFYPLIYPLRIRKKADLIQVWHAAGAFKTFGYSREGKLNNLPLRSKDHKNYTKVVVSSECVREKYAEGFGIAIDKVYAAGTPRSDIFFDDSYKSYIKETFYSKYSFLRNKKIILFAPTFRGYGQTTAYYPYENLELDTLYEALHDDYVFLFKIHPFVKNKVNIPYEYSDFFFDFSDYREINDLLFVTDILITDYSSVCFEFAILNRPMLFFAFDLETYTKERNFYYDYFNFIPGPLVQTSKGLVSAIKKEQFEMEKIPPFVKFFFDDNLGQSSKNVVDKVIIPSLENKGTE
ncbi:CDP-glycerol glycerophosphotransferase family protein [Virgibacillus sp. NKC19-3]|uniref:CDP-glycerol glycerophosphotransferase family protein n=1 Tax=Virgibacillus saliphilus TaxID=2831674 RepID=UPI001C9BAFD6|nr:CDP-glycerol glycerophosphotransferase family protein [Virgibacillus sp. NKC19-3]MBY7144660.1 CDP-glycerol glycerophosphotransferase family protein [Virgibacillus sp. NKC19-3]